MRGGERLVVRIARARSSRAPAMAPSRNALSPLARGAHRGTSRSRRCRREARHVPPSPGCMGQPRPASVCSGRRAGVGRAWRASQVRGTLERAPVCSEEEADARIAGDDVRERAVARRAARRPAAACNAASGLARGARAGNVPRRSLARGSRARRSLPPSPVQRPNSCSAGRRRPVSRALGEREPGIVTARVRELDEEAHDPRGAHAQIPASAPRPAPAQPSSRSPPRSRWRQARADPATGIDRAASQRSPAAALLRTRHADERRRQRRARGTSVALTDGSLPRRCGSRRARGIADDGRLCAARARADEVVEDLIRHGLVEVRLRRGRTTGRA